jgi:hypothetical protein
MKDKKEVNIQSLLKESLRLRRQISTKKYLELSREMNRICHEKDLLNEAIKNFNQKEGQLFLKLLERQRKFDVKLASINAKIAKNKALIESSSGKKSSSDIDKESALFFMDNLNKSAEEMLRLSEDDKQQLQVIMAKLEPIITDRDVQKRPPAFPPEGCLDCSGTCIGTCDGTCIGPCIASCSGSCLGPCEGSCGILCEGSCLGPCEGSSWSWLK